VGSTQRGGEMKASSIEKVGLSDSGPPSGTITRRFLESKGRPFIADIPHRQTQSKSGEREAA